MTHPMLSEVNRNKDRSIKGVFGRRRARLYGRKKVINEYMHAFIRLGHTKICISCLISSPVPSIAVDGFFMSSALLLGRNAVDNVMC